MNANFTVKTPVGRFDKQRPSGGNLQAATVAERETGKKFFGLNTLFSKRPVPKFSGVLPPECYYG